ncbi:uncharacterized protein LOC124460373 isoform X2 [Drosophila willistoni]|nr:uncharacterized protein LOC124460373 isoform X2 [Drosophila willistoni]
MHLTAIYFVVVLTERVCEIGMSILLISAAIRSNRYLLKIWMLCLSPVYLFNVSYGCYESLIKYDTLLGFILLIAIYVQTISLMVAYSFYTELGFIENHLRELADLRALRSAPDPERREKSFEDMELSALESFDKKAVRTTLPPSLSFLGYQRDTELIKTNTAEFETVSSRPNIGRRAHFDSTSLIYADDEETDFSLNNIQLDSSVIITDPTDQQRETDDSEM